MRNTKENNPIKVRWIALVIGFIVNVLGNSLTVVSNEGAEPWTAAAENAGKVTGASIGSFVILYGVIGAFINQIILSRQNRHKLRDYQSYRWHNDNLFNNYKDRSAEAGRDVTERVNHTFIDKFRFIAELLYIFVFGYAVDWGVLIFEKMHLNQLSTPWRILMSLVGVTMFCSAISVYQRANIFMHPNDDTSNLIRFRFLKGNAFWSQIVDILPALIICAVCWPFIHTVYSIGWGTIYSILFNGIIIGLSDKWIWPKLIHNHQKKHTFTYSLWY